MALIIPVTGLQLELLAHSNVVCPTLVEFFQQTQSSWPLDRITRATEALVAPNLLGVNRRRQEQEKKAERGKGASLRRVGQKCVFCTQRARHAHLDTVQFGCLGHSGGLGLVGLLGYPQLEANGLAIPDVAAACMATLERKKSKAGRHLQTLDCGEPSAETHETAADHPVVPVTPHDITEALGTYTEGDQPQLDDNQHTSHSSDDSTESECTGIASQGSPTENMSTAMQTLTLSKPISTHQIQHDQTTGEPVRSDEESVEERPEQGLTRNQRKNLKKKDKRKKNRTRRKTRKQTAIARSRADDREAEDAERRARATRTDILTRLASSHRRTSSAPPSLTGTGSLSSAATVRTASPRASDSSSGSSTIINQPVQLTPPVQSIPPVQSTQPIQRSQPDPVEERARPFRYDEELQALWCARFGCGHRTNCHDSTTVTCPACRPSSSVRYCQVQCLLDDIQFHWGMVCPQREMTGSVAETPIISRSTRVRPFVARREEWDSVERHRQAVYHTLGRADYYVFDDLSRLEGADDSLRSAEDYNLVRGTGPVVAEVHVFAAGSPLTMRDYFNTTLERCLANGVEQPDLVLALYAIVRANLLSQGRWDGKMCTLVCMQFGYEFGYRVPIEHRDF